MILTNSEVGSLKSVLNCWEWVGYISTAIVFIGCVGEFIAEFTHLPKSVDVEKKLARLSLVVLILGIAGELFSAVRTSQVSGQIIANIEERAADAEQKAGEANREAARLTKVAEDERVARVQIEEALAPRRLTTKQRSAISSTLSRFSGQPVTAIHNTFDVEAAVFAAEIVSTLKLAKWTMSTVGVSGPLFRWAQAPSVPVTGIFVEAATDSRSQLAARALSRELSNNGFSCRIRKKGLIGTWEKPPVVLIDVEPRPEGPQGEAKLHAEAQKNKK